MFGLHCLFLNSFLPSLFSLFVLGVLLCRCWGVSFYFLFCSPSLFLSFFSCMGRPSVASKSSFSPLWKKGKRRLSTPLGTIPITLSLLFFLSLSVHRPRDCLFSSHAHFDKAPLVIYKTTPQTQRCRSQRLGGGAGGKVRRRGKHRRHTHTCNADAGPISLSFPF